MAHGVIVKALSGFYYVKTNQLELIECRARGQFKLKGISPLVGDHVQFEHGPNGTGYVIEIEERSNSLIRPPISNVNQVILVFSARQPNPNWQLLDKFLVHTSQEHLRTHIVFSKCDLLPIDDEVAMNEWTSMKEVYRQIGYDVHETNRNDDDSFEQIRMLLNGNTSVLAGQSGVGKSSLLNHLAPDLQLQTGEISQKLGRGKHTTRHVELHPIGNGGLIADTPGFSQLDFFGLTADELGDHFHEFSAFRDDCKFRGCSHLHEPACAVRQALDAGHISHSRFESYAQFYRDIKEAKRRY